MGGYDAVQYKVRYVISSIALYLVFSMGPPLRQDESASRMELQLECMMEGGFEHVRSSEWTMAEQEGRSICGCQLAQCEEEQATGHCMRCH